MQGPSIRSEFLGTAPLTSIADAPDVKKPWYAYVTACAFQAQIALIHLDRVWSREGEPADPDVWRSPQDVASLWADLQGTVAAGIILSRLLHPRGVRQREGVTRAEAIRRSEQRGERLRSLLMVPDDSVLLQIQNVRDPLEHIDERFDEAVEHPTVVSISDFYVANEVYFVEPQTPEAQDDATHRNMRTFVPLSGMLMYGTEQIDLFAYEIALHQLLTRTESAVRELSHEMVSDDGRFLIGTFQTFRVGRERAMRRREGMKKFRQEPEVIENFRQIVPPRTVLVAVKNPVADGD